MATIAQEPIFTASRDERFFLRAAIVMTVVIVAGFSFQLAMGRSTFASPLRVHAHAILFMGWVGIYLLQNVFVATGRMELHRLLGWIAAVWLMPMVVSGFVVTAAMVQNGYVPFFFRPVHFLIFDPLSVLAFAGLTIAAIHLRRRTDWHRRLHFCAMAMLLAPAFGRLLPLPLLQPWAWETCVAVSMLFPIVGAWADYRRHGRLHSAWIWGIGATIAAFGLIELLTYSPAGLSIYDWVTEGTPGARVAPLDFAPPPGGPLMTGRS
ncbi:MAG TPA: hypothetical protein VFO69_01240 [Allosphingosinicella sp.]|nr:hypothetical protein [Allosphingosinicella sp.]